MKVFSQSLLYHIHNIRGGRVLLEHVQPPVSLMANPENNHHVQHFNVCFYSETLQEEVGHYDMTLTISKTIIDDVNLVNITIGVFMQSMQTHLSFFMFTKWIWLLCLVAIAMNIVYLYISSVKNYQANTLDEKMSKFGTGHVTLH